MVWDDPGPAPIRHSPTKDGGSGSRSNAAAQRSGGGGDGSTCGENASIGTALQSLDPLSTIMIVFCLLAY
jgi:hypothetical protein